MFKIKTATGKEFESDYAVTIPGIAFIRIVNKTLEEVEEILSDEKELPLQGYEDFNSVASITDEQTGIKIILKILEKEE